MTKQEELRNAYLKIFKDKDFDNSYLIPSISSDPSFKGLSDIFLTSISPDYEKAKNKIMIIGRETKGWDWSKNKVGEPLDEEVCVDLALKVHRNFFVKQINDKSPGGNDFHNFTWRVGSKSGKDGLIYSNLFCFDLNEDIPTRSPIFKEIKILSEKLLRAQIMVLRPDIILFMNGLDEDSVQTRRQYFPIKGEDKVCFNGKYFQEHNLTKNQLWEFDLKFEDQLIKSYRSYHPCARNYTDRKRAHEFLIDLLPDK